MPHRIRGISRTSLWNAWKAIRKELRRATVRDVVDHLEYDIDPNVWIDRLLKQIAGGTYEPAAPLRFTVAKSKGFSRRMTMPAIPDLVLYRAIGSYLQRKLKRRERAHVYYERGELSKAVQEAQEEAEQEKGAGQDFRGRIVELWMDYQSHGKRRQRAWLHYSQYRKHLIFTKIYRYIVTTDITNYFDTVLHSKLAECFHSVAAPPRMMGLLFFLLERLSIRAPFSDSPHVGLPVDEFDCSRQLAHLFLYEHDDRMVVEVGEEAYVRWMDDQNLGVDSRAAALKALARVGESLADQHLTANAGKSRILTLAEARRHFHLDINDQLDTLEPLVREKKPNRTRIRRLTLSIWRQAQSHEHDGEWDKILSRLYRYAAIGRSRTFRRRAVRDALTYPKLTRRIADYMRATGSVSEYLDFMSSLSGHEEQVYPDVNLTLVEGTLRLEPSKSEALHLRILATNILSGAWKHRGRDLCMQVAPLLLLRFADGRSMARLRTIVNSRAVCMSMPVIRASAIVYASCGGTQFQDIRRSASKMWINPLADIVRLIERIRGYTEVPGSYAQRLNSCFDSVLGCPYVDMRSVLAARLLTLNTKSPVRKWLSQKIDSLSKAGVSEYERRMLTRLLPVL